MNTEKIRNTAMVVTSLGDTGIGRMVHFWIGKRIVDHCNCRGASDSVCFAAAVFLSGVCRSGG